ncbi:PP2C family protein-serine/threonine phosphatase [Lentzea flaviverrucosa]|uniref:Sigma-B regulation protein RsbU (Phosphoserine phosphatase) n=1 Tax=Lentzea flaviverrucosa TaxID=200379 RepID=A0A1H9XW00_9PSEU|nr:SpoIIE family protein phosphatase [Lentzea flaviverrucosa]RDI18428.1 sigma-B regulation protein RsbU (phosphoserine phosphatase) [Lentzea flaviverrucosa]SES50365.1 sigma-B regulation protein RsbU (phosphoserine phosphatase) [Lentzea flaviverrucosa]
MCEADATGGGGGGDEDGVGALFSALLEDSAEDLYENAPCGYLSTLMDGTIAKVNGTLLGWLGAGRDELVGRRRFSDLLTVGGRMYYETHIGPMLAMHGEAGGLALELKAADGSRLPVLVTSTVKKGGDGTAQLIRITIFDARDRRAYERELLRARQVSDAERDRARQLASTLQRTLLPPSLMPVPGMEVAAYYHPASIDEVGGDFYDLFPLTGDSWGFFLGDVSGKGAEAAVVTSLARYTLRSAAVYNPEPVKVLDNLNTVLHQQYRGGDTRFCTVVYGSLVPDATGCAITLASGGHPPAIVVRAGGVTEFLHTPGGMLVGAIPDASFTEVTAHLGPGDTLLLYSDGLTEARPVGASRQRYSEEELLDFLAASAAAGASEVISALTALLTGFGDGVEDDTALLALSIPLPGSGDS